MKSFPAQAVGSTVQRWTRTDAALGILDMDEALYGTDWGVGGCLVLALALAPLLPGAQVWGVYRGNRLDHAVVFWQGSFIDYRGAAVRGETVLRRNREDLPRQVQDQPMALLPLRPKDVYGTNDVLAPPAIVASTYAALAGPVRKALKGVKRVR